jgi:hypothetical protein
LLANFSIACQSLEIKTGLRPIQRSANLLCNSQILEIAMTLNREVIISSVRLKCEAIDFLYSSLGEWKNDKSRSESNSLLINVLIADIYKILEDIKDEFIYLEAANFIEKTLTKMSRLREAGMLYDYADDRFEY